MSGSEYYEGATVGVDCLTALTSMVNAYPDWVPNDVTVFCFKVGKYLWRWPRKGKDEAAMRDDLIKARNYINIAIEAMGWGEDDALAEESAPVRRHGCGPCAKGGDGR